VRSADVGDIGRSRVRAAALDAVLALLRLAIEGTPEPSGALGQT
jgi:hypothetical protein